MVPLSASYAINSWLSIPAGIVGPNWFYGRRGFRESDAPVLTDGAQSRTDPGELDSAPADLENPVLTGPPMSLNCLDRHSFAVNVSFVDGHAETVKLPDLWTLKWHRDWTRSTPGVVPGR